MATMGFYILEFDVFLHLVATSSHEQLALKMREQV